MTRSILDELPGVQPTHVVGALAQRRPGVEDGAREAANDNDVPAVHDRRRPSDGMTLKEVQRELNLSEKQIITLRRLWGFPQPWHEGGHLLFSREEVRRWVRGQPNPDRAAAGHFGAHAPLSPGEGARTG